ncbi:hypothetical protein MKW92_007558 [Papaver armeniacum]|nr:hypothetical protein MKW92_007558 [Papaver armeniacum]
MSISKIPGDICKSIISRLPVRSVLACKCVCKSWLNLISYSDDFVQMHLDFHRENNTCLMFGGSEQGNDTQIHSIGYDSLASLLLPEIEYENDNAVEEGDSSATLSGVDGYAAQIVSPFKDSGTTVNNVKGRTVNSAYVELQILKKKNSVLEAHNAELEARNAELETRDAQLVASNAELHRKLHESQVAYENLEKHVNAQRKALKAGAAMLSSLSESTNLEDESLTVQQRVEKEQAKRVPLSVGGAPEPYQITEASKTHSTSTDSYQTKTVNSLRALLKERGLMVKGKKDELIARLRGI